MQANSDLVMSLSFVHSKVMKQVDNKLSLHGISFSELMVMYHLKNAPENAMKRVTLAESIALTASGVTRLLNPMEKRGLVQKEINPRDARVSLVKLSGSGEQVLTDAMESFNQASDAILTPLTEKQAAKLAKLIDILTN